MKNAHKPQTKAILEKIMQNRASSLQSKNAQITSGSGVSGNSINGVSSTQILNQVTVLDQQTPINVSIVTPQLSITGQSAQ
jgi:hypothetical protein